MRYYNSKDVPALLESLSLLLCWYDSGKANDAILAMAQGRAAASLLLTFPCACLALVQRSPKAERYEIRQGDGHIVVRLADGEASLDATSSE